MPSALAHDGPHTALGQPALVPAYEGLEYTAAGPCAGLYRITFTRYCTHGPDPEPSSAGLRRGTASAAGGAIVVGSVPKVQCAGDGTSGKRVQVIYARASDALDGYLASKAAIAAGAIDADRIFRESAAETSGMRRIRFVHDASCNLSILGTLEKWDDQPGPANLSNAGPGYSRVGPSCWNATNSAAAHELMHNLGAVQNTAPNWNGVGHCLDDTDRMCYDQFVPGFTFDPSARANHERKFDCGHGDYFHTNPLVGNYLDTHWNTADSDYLASSLGDAWAFVRADDPTATSYTPSEDTNQSSTNAKNTIARVGTGAYFVAFRNLGMFSAPFGNAQLTTYGSAGEHCNLSAATFSYLSPETIAGVICYSAAGSRVDAQFDASFVRPLSTAGDFAYLYANTRRPPRTRRT